MKRSNPYYIKMVQYFEIFPNNMISFPHIPLSPYPIPTFLRLSVGFWIINVNKIMKSIINANSLSPWSDELDLDTFLAPPPAPPLKNPTGNARQENERVQQRMQEEAKKTLLNIDSDKKRTNKSQIRQYLNRKSKNQYSHMSVQEAYDFKLPPISRPYDSIDYSVHQLLPLGSPNDKVDLFRKYGDHRRSKLNEGVSKVERSISYGPAASKEIDEQRRQKVQTLEPIQLDGTEKALKELKLKGKKFSCEMRAESERKLSSDQYKYIPSQPNITPHYMLFGHNKNDVLKKVLQQINQKMK